ncbi:MAG: AAA family ATPase [Deltaproteobacteria bacterium]|nr:AAA family ATPase [Deltaproteobacteria bacterium]
MIRDALIALAEQWSAGTSLIELITVEEDRAIEAGRALAQRVGSAFAVWSIHRGLDPSDPSAREPLALLDAIARHEGPIVAVLLDFQHELSDHRVARRLRDLLAWFAANDRCLVLVASEPSLPPTLQSEAATVMLAPPSETELDALFSQVLTEREVTQLPPAYERSRMVQAAQGLTASHARRTFARAISADPTLTATALGVITHEKKRLFARDLGLEFIDAPDSIDALGGLEDFKQWLADRRDVSSAEARKFGLKPPRGVLLLGVQGCGKSLSAKCAASYLGLPLVRLDLPRVMGASAEGPSAEESLRRALEAAERNAPIALWVDEIEKAFAGSGGKSADARTSRLLGAFSTWLQERSRPVFVVATANDVSQLPPELLRRGRFDELFFVDLPSLEAREKILAVHLERRGRALGAAELRSIAELCVNFSGAELEQVVLDAMGRSFALGRVLNEGDLRRAARELVPLYRTYEESIKQLREWARGRARPAGRQGTVVDLFRRANLSES